MDLKLLRIVYIAEFLLALVAVFTAWSQIGGQGHLDQMAWYVKLSLGLLMSYAIVRATAAAVSEERGWNARALRWTGILVLLVILAGLATYYTHLYEPADEDNDSQTTTSLSRVGRTPWSARDPLVPLSRMGTDSQQADEGVGRDQGVRPTGYPTITTS